MNINLASLLLKDCYFVKERAQLIVWSHKRLTLSESFNLGAAHQRYGARLYNLLVDRKTVRRLDLLLINCLLRRNYVLIPLCLGFKWTRQSKLKLVVLIGAELIEVKYLSVKEDWLASQGLSRHGHLGKL